MKKLAKTLTLTALCLPLLGGCAVDEPSLLGGAGGAAGEHAALGKEGDLLPGKIVAQLMPVEGLTINFYSSEPYGVVVDAVAAPGVALPGVLREGLLPVALYEHLSGQSAPEELVVASDYAIKMAKLNGEYREDIEVELDSVEVVDSAEVEIDVEADLELGVSAHWGNHTGAEWIDSHCKNSLNVYWDYTDCKANRMCSGGESSCTLYSNNGTSAYGAVNPYRGSLRLKLYRKNTWGNWKLQESRFINEGYTAYVADTITWKRGQKVALSEAGGTAFHYEVLAYY